MSLLLTLLLWFSPVWAQDQPVVLAVGEQVRLPGKFHAVTVTNPKAAKVLFTGGGLLINGRQPGLAYLHGAGQTPTAITVFSQKMVPARRALLAWLSETYGLELVTEPQRLVLAGTALRLADWTRIQEFRRQFPLHVQSQVKPSPTVLEGIKMEVGKALKLRSLASSSLQTLGDRLVVSSPAGDKGARELADEWGLDHVPGGPSLELKPMVEVEIIIAEVRKSFLQNLGLALPGIYAAALVPSEDVKSMAVKINPLNVSLNLQSEKGGARVLANPKIVCRSGEAAHFVAGGEIPIKIISWRNSDIVWKKYGVILDIFPKVDQQEGISTKITTEVSLLDETHKVDGIPAFLTNRIETHFDVRGSKTIALSGLIKSETGRRLTATAGLGDLPIIGELFKSRDYQDSRTELVVFVTPRVISPENPPPPGPPPLLDENWDENSP